MNKQQILTEISVKIAGQGSAVDAGSALPGILSSITNLIPESGGGDEPLDVADISTLSNEQVANLNVGDLVAAGSEDKEVYIVAYVLDDVDKKKALVYVKDNVIKTVTYTYNDNPEAGETGWGEGSGRTVTVPANPIVTFTDFSEITSLLPAGKIVVIGDAGDYEDVYTVTKSTLNAMELTSVNANVIKTAKFTCDEGGEATYVETVTTTLTPDAPAAQGEGGEGGAE